MKRSRTMMLVLPVILGVALIAPLPAASAAPIRPPKVEQPGKAPTWLYYLVGGGVVLVGVGLAVFPSRRTHED